MSFDDDPPTRRLPVPPREPGHPREPLPPREREPVPPAPGGGTTDVQLYALEQQLRSLRSWLVALAAVAVIALAVAAVALVSGGGDDSSSGSAQTPASLRRSVARLESRLDDRATKGDLSDVKAQVAKLQSSVAAAADAAKTSTTPATDGGADAASLSAVQSDVGELQDRVSALEQAGAASGGTTPADPSVP